jgi:hypothetical protein
MLMTVALTSTIASAQGVPETAPARRCDERA